MHRVQISLGFPLERAPEESLALEIQGIPWSPGLVRAAGLLDVSFAGYAIVNDATVLAADHDFVHIAAVGDLKKENVPPLS